jgi:hypothetical protein
MAAQTHNNRFYTHASKGVFLHLEDAPAIQRIRLVVMRYDHSGLTACMDYYLMPGEARLLFHRLVNTTPAIPVALRSGVPGKVRELKLETTGDPAYPLRLSLSAMPAVPTGITGHYRPRKGARKATERLLLTTDQATSLGLAGQEYLLVSALSQRMAFIHP